jgi:hypothetical protein
LDQIQLQLSQVTVAMVYLHLIQDLLSPMLVAVVALVLLHLVAQVAVVQVVLLLTTFLEFQELQIQAVAVVEHGQAPAHLVEMVEAVL